MARLVAGIGVPHSPHYPAAIAKDGSEETARLFREVKAHLDAARADAIVVIANDHFNTFFLNNFPTFAIGGPKIEPGKRNAVPDLAWSRHVHRRMAEARFDELVEEATPERMWQAGNIGGELLNWIVTLGVIGKDRPRYIADHNDKDGHAY